MIRFTLRKIRTLITGHIPAMYNDEYCDSVISKYSYVKSYSDLINELSQIHGVFEQDPSSHMKLVKCPKCYIDRMRYDNNKFIELSKKKHGNKYDYSLVDYKHTNKKVKIICPTHGIFEQGAGSHINGAGCPSCNESRGEREISILLDNKNIKYIREKCFDDCIDQRYLPFDFYLPELNICVEFDGIQHFKPIKYFGGEKTLKITQKHDKMKNEYCKENNIHLIRIKYNEKIMKKLSWL